MADHAFLLFRPSAVPDWPDWSDKLREQLLCSYLYAAFSLKRGAEEGLTAMAHLALVNNLLVFVGGSPGYHPAGFTVEPGVATRRSSPSG